MNHFFRGPTVKPASFSRLRTARRIRQFNLSLLATLAVMALAS